MRASPLFRALPLLLALLLLSGGALAQDNAPEAITLASTFTYQGYLERNGVPLNGNCDMQFSLFDALTGGAQIGNTVTRTNVTVTDGVFTVPLDAGTAVFNGGDRYVAVSVRCPATAGVYTSLTPRQPITPVPYAIALYGLRTEANSTSPNIIAGFSGNSITPGVVGATIAGGGNATDPNVVTDNYGTIGGGFGNQAGDNAFTSSSNSYATVSGGTNNVARGVWSTIGGGFNNNAGSYGATIGGGETNQAFSPFSTIAGGFANRNYGDHSTIGGGNLNYITSTAYLATIGGGGSTDGGEATGNLVTDRHGTIGGGGDNQAGNNNASGTDTMFATVGGGESNTASGAHATVPGGSTNTAAGDHSLAAGRRASIDAAHDYSFVWSGTSDAAGTASWGANTFTARAPGGVRFYTTSAGTTNGVELAAGSSSWSVLSDRHSKENFAPIDTRAVLDRLISIPVTTWNYITQDDAVRHIGVVAQDFYAAFSVGEGDTRISTVDADGVLFAAVQGLNSKLESENAALRSELDGVRARLAALEALANGGQQSALVPLALLGGLLGLGALLGRRRG